MSRAFTPKRVAEIEPRTRAVRATSSKASPPAAAATCNTSTRPSCPSVVIGTMIGIPDDRIDDFRSWTDSFLEIQGPQDYLDSLGKCYELFAELLAERRRAPRDDLMSALLAAEVDGQQLTEEELLGFCFLLVLAGTTPPPASSARGTVLLANDPEQRAMLVRDPSLWANAVEEINRLESPDAGPAPHDDARRGAARHGDPVGFEGDARVGLANHDEREFPDPERFDIRREITKHLAFGHGTHFCLGSNLARLEARVAFEELHARLPDYELDGTPRRITSIWRPRLRRDSPALRLSRPAPARQAESTGKLDRNLSLASPKNVMIVASGGPGIAESGG